MAIKEALDNGTLQEPLLLNTDLTFEGNSPLEHTEIDGLNQISTHLYKAIKALSKEISYLSVVTSETIRQMGLVNTQGCDLFSSKRRIEVSVSLTLEKPVHRSFDMEKTFNTMDQITLEDFIRPINEWLNLPTHAASLPSNDCPAVLAGIVMCNILLTAWQMFSGADYVSHQTPYSQKLHQCVASNLVTLSDLPLSGACGYDKDFDCEGTLTQDLVLIDRGMFKHLMHNQASGRKMAVPSTGHAGRDTNLISDQTEVKIIPSHFVLEEGQTSQAQMLESLANGIYIYESYDMFHSLNTASGDFAIPCKGIVYENHEAKGVVSGLTISGNFVDLLKSIEKVGNESSVLSVVMSKSFQVKSPSVYVSEIHVTGGQ